MSVRLMEANTAGSPNATVEDQAVKKISISKGPTEGDEQCFAGSSIGVSERRGNCRSAFYTTKWALVFLSIGALLQHLTLNGLLSVAISTLERRFELRSTESGIIASCFGISSFVAMIFISLADEDVHKTKWFGRGAFMNGISAFLFALPHFVAPTYMITEAESHNFCGNVTVMECGASSLRNYRFFFVGAVFLMGIGASLQHSYGITYLDENVSKENSALYNSIYLAVLGLGPAIGFVGGGASLELYTYPSQSVQIDSRSALWVGAWWLGFLIAGVLIFISAVPITMLPRHLPGTEKFRKNRDIEMQKISRRKEHQRSSVRKVSDIVTMLRNLPFMSITLATAVNSAFIFGFNTFGAKYLESVFGLIPFHASVLYGVTAIIASFCGHLVSGYLIKRFSMTMNAIIKFTVISGIFSAVCSIAFLVHCEDIDFAGGTAPYLDKAFVQSPYSECNENCGCSEDKYDPVCHNGMTFFSPCFAGCSEKINNTVYGSCSCAPEFSGNFSHKMAVVSSDSCERNQCSMIYPFVIIVFFCFFSSIMTIPPSFQITLRCVRFEKRILAVSFQRIFVVAIGVVPGRILTGVVMDLACVSWSTECGEQGSCKAYRRWDLARNSTMLLLAQTATCALLYIVVFVTYDPVGGDENNLTGPSPEENNVEHSTSKLKDRDSESKEYLSRDDALSPSAALLHDDRAETMV